MPPYADRVSGRVAHCSRSQDIDLFKFQLSYCYNLLQDTCPITSAVLGHLIRTHVLLIFLDRNKKSHRLSKKCTTPSLRGLAMGQQLWLVAWQHQAITWINAYLSSIRFSKIHLKAISQEITHPSITESSLRIMYKKISFKFPREQWDK